MYVGVCNRQVCVLCWIDVVSMCLMWFCHVCHVCCCVLFCVAVFEVLNSC